MGGDLTIPLFLVSTALTLGMTGITQAELKHRALIGALFVAAFLCAVLGILWPVIQTSLPRVALATTDIARSEVSWFVLVMACVVLVFSGGNKSRSITLPSRIDLGNIGDPPTGVAVTGGVKHPWWIGGAAAVLIVAVLAVNLAVDHPRTPEPEYSGYSGRPVLTTEGPFQSEESSYEGRPIGIAWGSAMLHGGNSPTIPQLLRIASFEVWAKNLGPDQPRLKSAILVSGIDGTEIKMQVGDNINGLFDPAETSPVPVGAPFEAYATFSPTGLPVSEFLEKWGVFRVILTYEDKTLAHTFDRDWVVRAVAAQDPHLGPHLSKRQ